SPFTAMGQSDSGSQRTEDRKQRTEVLDLIAVLRMSLFRASPKEWPWIGQQGTKDAAHFAAGANEANMIFRFDKATVLRKIKRGVGFITFGVAVGQLAEKMRLVPALRPGFTQVEAYRSG